VRGWGGGAGRGEGGGGGCELRLLRLLRQQRVGCGLVGLVATSSS
jgi:hypothetical protein